MKTTKIGDVLMNQGKSLAFLMGLAKGYSDGHFTVMKFTTNWRVSLKTITSMEQIESMAEGRTLEEAIANLVEQLSKVNP